MKMMAKRDCDETSSQVKKMNLPPIIFMVVGFCLHTAMADCPSLCECKWKNGKETVTCHNANLSRVPLHLDSGTQVLDLTGNNVQTLKNEEFSNAGLLNLQRIFISKCRLKNLQRYVFKNLKNLVELDLSVNSLSSVPSHTFDSIPELRELKLNENPIQRITNDAFTNLPQLVRLEMSTCRISEIEKNAFVGLEKSLEWLKIDDNNLMNIHSNSLTRLENLHGLELAGNPWNCSCTLRPLRKWILTTNIPFGIPPTCQFPQRLKNKSWDKLDLDEFACIPEISPSHTITYGVEGKNVTITCRIAGNPEPNVRWILRNKVIANFTGPNSNGKKSYILRLQNDSSDLTIFSADLQDAGVYICAAENKAGKVEASVTLAVSKKPQEYNMSGRVLLVSVLIGILLVIASCLLVLCVLTRRTPVIKWKTRGECENRDENYEKIELNHKIIDKSNGGVVQRSEISLVNNAKKNGDYCVVPANDIEQDLDDDEASTLDIASKSSQWSRNNEDEQEKWKKPDPVDLHIPQRIISETRDDFPRITTSKSGTFKKVTEPSSTANFAKIPRESPDGYGVFVNPSFSTGFAGTSSQESSKKFPDIVGSKPLKFPGARSNSEGGSVNDLSDLFCTLPRKTPRIYRSTDSEAPLLLTDSRYTSISSGGESYSSQDESNSIRKDSTFYKHATLNNLNKNRVNQTSNSYLNLCRVERPSTSATPLLNVSNLENRPTRTEIFSPSSTTPNANTYDYHATQLERFLEEYKNLQKQLTKMKETCDNLTNLKPMLSRTNSSNDMMENNSRRSTCSPNFNNTVEDSEFRNFQSELTKYLLAKSSSPKPYASGSMFNN